MKKLLLAGLILLSVISCRTLKLRHDLTFDNAETPPGTVKLERNLYVDGEEISNLDYFEFLTWMKRVYGDHSIEYTSMLPDANAWKNLNPHYASLDTFYLTHPTYRHYPVVGVSYHQAVRYSKWRSDRLMEFLLVREGIIPYRRVSSKDSIFTIEKYFSGHYFGVQPNPHFFIYPCYTLPDSATYYKAAVFSDSLNARNYKYYRRKKYGKEDLLIECNCLEKEEDRTDKYPFGITPTKPGTFPLRKKDLIVHLKGNVREMMNTEGLIYGSSFYDSCKTPDNIYRHLDTDRNSYTGFRNMCVYKQWGK